MFAAVACLVYEKTGSIFACIAIHATFNTVASLGSFPVVAIVIGVAMLIRAACWCPDAWAWRHRPSRRERPDRPGALALVLHSHMPYVEGFDTWPFGEEWLWEATASVYLPLLERLERAPCRSRWESRPCWPTSWRPCATATRAIASCASCARFAREVHDLGRARSATTRASSDLAAEVRRAAGDYERAAAAFEARDRDLISAFGALESVELWTSAATHALLPLVATEPGLALQLGTGTRSHERRFGHFNGGFWLPECAYVPGLERDLADHGVRAFCVDQPGARPLRPVATEAGPVAVPIDWETISAGLERDAPATRHTRSTATTTTAPPTTCGRGATAASPTTRRRLALRRMQHARDFVERVAAKDDLVCCALDTELLGHWWYEGLEWLSAVLEEAPRRGVDLVTVSEGIERVEPVAAPSSRASSWGTDKDLSHLGLAAGGRAGLRRARAPSSTCSRLTPRARASARGLRELLALQSSDWAFLVTEDLAADYPLRRARGARGRRPRRFGTLPLDPALHNLAPDLDLASSAHPDPLLGVPAADRGRPGPARPQAGRGPRRPRAWRCT